MKILIRLFFLLTVLTTHLAVAGSANNTGSALNPDEVAIFAKDVEKYAAARGARAFIIGRVGRPLSELPSGVRFTHTAIAVYSSIQLESGETVNGYAIHNLYQDTGQSNKSNLVVDYPVDFFWGAHALIAGIIIPTADLQQRLIESIADGTNLKVHNPQYSVLSNPFNSQLQNCTEHTLDIINASIYKTTDLEQLKINAKAHFKPQRIKRSLKLILGGLFMNELSTRDHKNKIYTTTFTTIGHYLEQNKLTEQTIIINQDGSTSQLL